MKTKKIIALILLTLAFCMSFIGCGKSEKTEEVKAYDKIIEFVIDNGTHNEESKTYEYEIEEDDYVNLDFSINYDENRKELNFEVYYFVDFFNSLTFNLYMDETTVQTGIYKFGYSKLITSMYGYIVAEVWEDTSIVADGQTEFDTTSEILLARENASDMLDCLLDTLNTWLPANVDVALSTLHFN